jgi:Uncharacterized membrane protein, required for colicin V production
MIDTVLLIVIGGSALLGLIRGFVGTLVSTAAWLLAGWATFEFGGQAAFWLSDNGKPTITELFGGYALSFVVVMVVVVPDRGCGQVDGPVGRALRRRSPAGHGAWPAARRVPGQHPRVADGFHSVAARGGLAAIAGPADAHARSRLDAFQAAELVGSANGFSQPAHDGR